MPSPAARRTASLSAGLALIAGLALVAGPLVATAAKPIDGTGKPDELTGTSGDDVITAKAGDDIVMARGGDDLVLAGAGADEVNGQRGSDELRGGAGADVLISGKDKVRDYVVGNGGGDRIYLTGQDFGFAGPGNDRVWLTYPAAGAKVRCGGGHDVLVYNQEPPKDVTVSGCEVVKVVSAG